MRIKIQFSNPNPYTYLPINTNYYLVQLIEHLTYEYRRYLNSLLPAGERSKPFTMYTFSQLIVPERKIKDFQLGILSQEFYWYVASPFYQFLGILAKELKNRKKVKIYNKWFPVKQVRFICSPSFEKAEAKFICLSPVTVYKQEQSYQENLYHKYSQYLLPDQQPDYKQYLERDLQHKYHLLFGKNPDKLNFDLEFDRNYMRKKNNKITKVITLEKGGFAHLQVRGVLAPLHIKAHPEVLKLIYDVGLGQLNNLGFGMLETIH